MVGAGVGLYEFSQFAYHHWDSHTSRGAFQFWGKLVEKPDQLWYGDAFGAKNPGKYTAKFLEIMLISKILTPKLKYAPHLDIC